LATTPSTQPKARITPALFTKRDRYALIYLSAGFIILSGLGHFVLGAAGEHFFPQFKEEATPPPQKVTVQTLIKPPPTPKPTPKPTPTPLPTPTPPPLKNTPPPAHLKMNVVKTHSEGGTGPAEVAYTPPPHGSENGVPSAPPTEAPTANPRPVGPTTATDSDFKNRVIPEYPELVKEQGIQGTAVVEVTIAPSGALLSAKIYQSSGNPLLDNAALKAARASTFKQATYQNDYLIDYVFQIE
jgi:TonB family protein